jgi:hypothetical protein
MSKWHNMIKKPTQKRFEKTVKEEIKERNENFKQNWQNWHDENQESD